MANSEPNDGGLVLKDEELHALFYILVHNQTYSEIAAFTNPRAIATAGHPFAFDDADAKTANNATQGRDGQASSKRENSVRLSSDPLLQMLSVAFVLPIPGLRDIPSTFWSRCVQGIVSKFGQAELSESYDQGAIGSRRTLSTAASAVVEAFARGYLGGLKKVQHHPLSTEMIDKIENEDEKRTMRMAKLAQDWNEFMEQVVYEDMIDRVCDSLKESADIEAHIPIVQGAMEYAITHLATFLHRSFVVSPEGPFVVQLLDTGNKLVPYAMLRQVLRVGNAATMVNGLAKLLLSKLSLGSISNWLGFTQGADEGQNLLQRIIDTVMMWDCSEASRTIDKLEKSGAVTPLQVHAINRFMEEPREVHEAVRQKSIDQSISIIKAIIENYDEGIISRGGLLEEHVDPCMQLYGAKLMIRDRQEIVSILCKQTPDLFTEAVRNAITAYDPVIRELHAHIDLSSHVTAGENFVADFIATCRQKNGGKASVEDFVALLKKHRHSLYAWLHDALSKCDNVHKIYRDYLKSIAPEFRQKPTDDKDSRGLSDIHAHINKLFQSLSEEDKKRVVDTLEEYVHYLLRISDPNFKKVDTLTKSSRDILDAMGGPATSMASWQALVDQSKITPATLNGPLRGGRDVCLKPMSRRKMTSGAEASTSSSLNSSGSAEQALPENVSLSFPLEPKTDHVIKLFGGEFNNMLQQEALKRVVIPEGWAS